jgi:hypothetical protein
MRFIHTIANDSYFFDMYIPKQIFFYFEDNLNATRELAEPAKEILRMTREKTPFESLYLTSSLTVAEHL